MKKIHVLIAIFLCVFFIVGCGSNKGLQIETEPMETKPAETEPAETEPIETEPAETEPIETEPAETEPAETEPIETEPAETEPAETEPESVVTQVERNDAYFDHSLFIGDSIMAGIERYVLVARYTEKTLGNARFLTSIYGIALADLVNDRQSGVYYSYQGVPSTVDEIIAAIDREIQVKHIFFMLGQNDLCSIQNPSVTDIADRYLRLIDRLSKTFPDADFIILTNTPKLASEWLPDYVINRNYNNELISESVKELIKMCQDNNIPYLDIHGLMKDSNNALPNAYCSDGYAHLSYDGAKVVVDALYEFAAGKE